MGHMSATEDLGLSPKGSSVVSCQLTSGSLPDLLHPHSGFVVGFV